ncbi:MAG: Si-specific NAD(P)(+) transhydrogenase, partial [Pseudomonadota bacterium]
MQHYDMIVIGSGPAGRRAAIQAAKLGRSVLVLDRGRRIGGVSVHTGTIPSKTLRETVLNLSGWRERGFYGMAYRVKKEISAEDLLKRLHITLNHEVEVLEHQFARNSVTTLRGAARFLSPTSIEVTGDEGETKQYSADRFILAVGTRPYRPDHVPFDGECILDSDEILDLQRLPRHLTVVGAGVIGVEYATIFSALDVRVTLIEGRNHMLEFVDRELLSNFTYDIRDRGIALRLGCKVKEIERNGSQCIIRLEDGRTVRSDMVLYAAGRMGSTADLNLEAAGLECDRRGRLQVDKNSFQTSVPHIYAAGDVIGFPSLASTSMEQGRIAACRALDHDAPDPPAFFPYGIYAVPEIST